MHLASKLVARADQDAPSVMTCERENVLAARRRRPSGFAKKYTNLELAAPSSRRALSSRLRPTK